MRGDISDSLVEWHMRYFTDQVQFWTMPIRMKLSPAFKASMQLRRMQNSVVAQKLPAVEAKQNITASIENGSIRPPRSPAARSRFDAERICGEPLLWLSDSAVSEQVLMDIADRIEKSASYLYIAELQRTASQAALVGATWLEAESAFRVIARFLNVSRLACRDRKSDRDFYRRDDLWIGGVVYAINLIFSGDNTDQNDMGDLDS